MTSTPPQTDSNAQKPGTRERLLDEAERVFAERGFSGASVREITDAAGANLAAINYHFQSKENLYAAVFSRRFAHVHEEFLARLQRDRAVAEGGLEQGLTSFGRAFLGPYADPEYSQRVRDLCVRELIEAKLPPGLFLREFITPMNEMIAGIVRRARPGLDETTARGCAESFFAQLVHVVKGARVAGTDPTILEERLSQVVRFTATAIRHI
jgi:AcrR family transcriptional regulator